MATLTLEQLRAAVIKAFRARESASKAIREGLKAMFPNQAALKAYGHKAYSEFREECKKAGIAGGLAEKSWDKVWQRALASAGLKPIGADGEPTSRGGTGAANKTRASASKASKAEGEVAVTDQAACEHFFGHSDADLIAALRVAAANEQAFLRFAAEIVAAAGKAKTLKAA